MSLPNKRSELIEIAKDLGISDLFGMRSDEIRSRIRNHPRSGYEPQDDKVGDHEGYVYILVSSAKPGIVKIGCTDRNPEQRAKELSNSTGVAMPYIVAYHVEVEDPERVERDVHQRLSESRVNPNREFFEVPVKRAIDTIFQEM
jgi:hypothetical protein